MDEGSAAGGVGLGSGRYPTTLLSLRKNMVGSHQDHLMRRNCHEVHSQSWVPIALCTSGIDHSSRSVPTEEDREKLHRMADAYDEAEHERVVRLAFPSPPPESS